MEEVKVKAYLNKRLKPSKNKYGRESYPVYLRFNLNGSNHRLSSNYLGYLYSDNELEKYERDIKEESFLINNFIKINKGIFIIQDYNDYFQRFGRKIHDIYLEYLDYGLGAYEANFMNDFRSELQKYIEKTSGFELDFLKAILNIELYKLPNKLPYEFIDVKNSRQESLVFDILAINRINEYSEKLGRDINVYDWLYRGVEEEFRIKFGDLSYSRIDHVVELISMDNEDIEEE